MRRILPVLLVLAATAQQREVLSPDGRIELPGVNGRIDHLTADVKGQRMFVSALGNGTVEVLDVRAGKHVRTLTGLAEPQGVYYDAATNRLFVACGGDGAVVVYDAGTFQRIATAKFSGDADNIRYDARGRRVVVGYGEGGLGFLDTAGKKTGEIPLDAHPESFQLEKNGARVFVNVPDRKKIEVADLAANKVLANWTVKSAGGNFPMALDEERHRLLIGCRTPARVLAIDTATGTQTASVEIPGDTDDLFYDPGKKRVYVIAGQGFLDVFEQTDADHYRLLSRYPTAPGARTGLFVPEWERLFVAVPHRGEQRAEIRVFASR